MTNEHTVEEIKCLYLSIILPFSLFVGQKRPKCVEIYMPSTCRSRGWPGVIVQDLTLKTSNISVCVTSIVHKLRAHTFLKKNRNKKIFKRGNLIGTGRPLCQPAFNYYLRRVTSARNGRPWLKLKVQTVWYLHLYVQCCEEHNLPNKWCYLFCK